MKNMFALSGLCGDIFGISERMSESTPALVTHAFHYLLKS